MKLVSYIVNELVQLKMYIESSVT